MTNNNLFKFSVITLFALTIWAYSNHFNNVFHFDDFHTISNNPFIRSLKNIPLFFKDGTTFSVLPANQSYRPVVSTSLAIDYALGGGYDPFYFHLSTFILYLLQGVLMYFLVLKLAGDFFGDNVNNRWFALFTAGFYTIHTANAETINYVISRSDTLSTQGLIAGFAIYLYFEKLRKFGIYLIPIVIGILAKPTTVMFFPILMTYEFLKNISAREIFSIDKNLFNDILKSLIAALPAILVCLAGYLFVEKMTPQTWTSGGGNKFEYIIAQPIVTLHYFHMFLLPTELSADTDWGTLKSMSDPKFIVGMCFITGVIISIFISLKNKQTRIIAFGLVWFLIALLPTAIVPLSEVLNDHRTFFPYVGLAIAVCGFLYFVFLKIKNDLMQNAFNKSLAIVLILVVFCGHAYGVRVRNVVWLNENNLWLDVTIKSPKNARGLMNYGLTKMAKGEYAEARKYFTRGLELYPYYTYLHINMAIVENATGNPDKAEEYYKTALQYAPNAPNSYTFYAKFLFDKKRYEESKKLYEKAIELNPTNINVRNDLANLYLAMGLKDKLKEILTGTLQIDPNDAVAIALMPLAENDTTGTKWLEAAAKNASPENYLNISLQLYNAGRYEDCIKACEKAIELKPDYSEAYNNMCTAYNMLKKWDKAAEACKKAVALKPDYTLAKNNLNWALQNLPK